MVQKLECSVKAGPMHRKTTIPGKKSESFGCFRNLLLVTGPQVILGKALASNFEPPRFDAAEFGSNILYTTLLPTIDDGSTP
jgi:hypothetical protein